MKLCLLRVNAVLALFVATLAGIGSAWGVAQAEVWPYRVPLPDGFEPEGIAMGYGSTAYVGSLSSGAIYAVNLRTGEGEMLVEAQSPQSVAGMMVDPRTGYLFVAGIQSGNALIFDTRSGELVQEIQLSSDPNTLINDVAIARDAVYFTDSHLPVFYKVSLAAGGKLPYVATSEAITLTGEFEFTPEALNSNGIVVSPDGKKLIIATTDDGKLYKVDAATGAATLLQLDEELDLYHDGLVLAGQVLYVVNGKGNGTVYQIALAPDWTTGTLQRTINVPGFNAISTAAQRGDSLYVVNARWDAERTPETEYWLTRVKR